MAPTHGNEADTLPLERRLRQEILFARERVYRFGQPTPLERLVLPGSQPGPEVWVKREDLSAIKCYKWRGAANRMFVLTPQERARGVVTASAGNHAQGVAMAARKLGVQARIFMPRSTPRVKQQAVLRHGGDNVQVVLSGDSYDDAMVAARAYEAETNAVYVHAYDDLLVMAGQGTLADEVVLSGNGPFDAAFLQIGGGGMAAGTSVWLKTYWPGIEIVGVEGEGQASMRAALLAGKPRALEQLDIFCDGTAVRKAGALPFAICRDTLARIDTVTNSQVSTAISVLWEGLRCVPEPSAAMGLAAVLQRREELAGKRVLVIVTGANVDFRQLGIIAQSQGSAAGYTRALRIHIPERADTLRSLLETSFSGLNISDLQYGRIDNRNAWPVITFDAEDPAAIADLPQRLHSHGLQFEDVSDATDVAFRAIPLRGDLLANPVFLRLEFYERPGALHDFLNKLVRDRADICYFNYRQSGERIGRALIGLDFDSPAARDAMLASIPERGEGYRSCRPVEDAARIRLTGGR